MGKFLEILNLFGVKATTIAWLSLMIMTGTTASSITIFMLDFKKSISKLEQMEAKVDEINANLIEYAKEADERMSSSEKAIKDISTLHEKQDKDYYDFTLQSIKDRNTMGLMYDQKILRLKELHNYYLPTKNSNSFTIREN